MEQATLTGPAELAAWFAELKAGDRLRRGINTYRETVGLAYDRGGVYAVQRVQPGKIALLRGPKGFPYVLEFPLSDPRKEVPRAKTAPTEVTYQLGAGRHTASWRRINA